MATPREVRQLAFQTLFEMDARGDSDPDLLKDSLEGVSGLTDKERARALEMATGAWEGREAADATMLELAPAWPAYRQAAVDRAILRLAHFEMMSGHTPPKIAVNEAIELAKSFSTKKSPSFVNGLLDKVLKRVLAAEREAESQTNSAEK